MSGLWALVAKEIKEEFRDLPGAAVVLLFPVLLVVIVHFALHPSGPELPKVLAALPALALSLGVPLVLLHAGSRERNTPVTLYLLASPVDPVWIFLARTFLRCLWLFFMASVTLASGLFFLGGQASLPVLGWLMLMVGLAAVGAASLGVLAEEFSRGEGSAHLAVVILPFLAPMVMALSDAGFLLFDGAGSGEIIGWLRLLVAFAILPLLVGVFFYDRVLRG